jgi:hypothetical protein
MLYAIHKGNVQGYKGGQNSIIHLVTEIEKIVELNLDFAFTDGHAIMDYSDFYDDISALHDVIDWELMESKYWFDTEEYPNRKFFRQAEFLVHQFYPWKFIKEIGVVNNSIKIKVQNLFQNQQHQPFVKICPDWYY